ERMPFEARHSDRHDRAPGRNRRQNDVNPDAVVKPHIDRGGRLVDVSTSERDEPHRERPQLRLAERQLRSTKETFPPVNPDLIRAVDEDIGDAGVCHETRKLTELGSEPRRRSERSRLSRATRNETLPGHELAHDARLRARGTGPPASRSLMKRAPITRHAVEEQN